jgi:hypothetical protein
MITRFSTIDLNLMFVLSFIYLSFVTTMNIRKRIYVVHVYAYRLYQRLIYCLKSRSWYETATTLGLSRSMVRSRSWYETATTLGLSRSIIQVLVCDSHNVGTKPVNGEIQVLVWDSYNVGTKPVNGQIQVLVWDSHNVGTKPVNNPGPGMRQPQRWD